MVGAMQSQEFVVTATWDDEAKVWVAESDDIPGLVTEAATEVQLIEKLKTMVPELLTLNGRPFDRSLPISLLLKSHQERRISVQAAA